MEKKAASGTMLTLLLLSMLYVALFSVVPNANALVEPGVYTNPVPPGYGFTDFEEGIDGQVVLSTLPGLRFTTTLGYDWVYGDVRTGFYNARSLTDPSVNFGDYVVNGYLFAWLGPNMGQGRIDFVNGTASYLSVLTSTYSGLSIDAYDSNNSLIATSGWTSGNLYTYTFTRLTVQEANMSYVIIHDTGNYWLIDDLVTDAPGTTPPVGNLIATGIRPVQVVWDSGINLVQDKAADFEISYQSTFTTIVETDIRVEATGFTPNEYQFRQRFLPGSHSFVIGSEHLASPIFVARTKPEVSYRFTIDPGNLVVEADETDNIFPRTGYAKRKVTDTKSLRVLFVAVRFNDEDGYPGYFNGFSRADFQTHAAESDKYLKATYPLAESEVSYYLACFNAPVNAGPRPTTKAKADSTFLALIDKLAQRAGSYYDRVIGVVKVNWFSGIPGWDGVLGFAGMGWGKGAVVTLGYWKTSPHEIGHTYSLDHSNANGLGYYVIGRKSVNAQTFMSTGAISNPPAQPNYKRSVPSFWIRNPEYQTLLTTLTKKADPEILLVSSTFWLNGTVLLGDCYRFPSGTPDFEEGGIGNYSIVQIDNMGYVLSTIGFNVTFVDELHGYSFDEVPLTFAIPYANGTKTIRILNATGNIVASKVISNNAPTVHVISPNGGEVLISDQVQVSWEASDIDGDPLVYNILVSGDGGLTWNPAETGWKQTTYNLTLTGFSGGTSYLIKVIASDGVNTGEDVSDGFFTISSFTIDVITPPQIVPQGDTANYTLNITSYGGFSGSISLNATSPDTENLIFQWITGSTVTLLPNSSTTSILEAEATYAIESGNFTIVISGISGNKEEVAITCVSTLTNDIAIVNITPSKTVIGAGFSVYINVTIQNQGYYQEAFRINLFCNETLLVEQTLYMHGGVYETTAFLWNTTGFAYGNYTISAYAWPVPGETDTTDNTLTCLTTMKVTIPGDIDGDFMVKPLDLALLIAAFGSDPYPPNPRPWNPNADINGDDKVGPYDLAVLIAHYGQHYP